MAVWRWKPDTSEIVNFDQRYQYWMDAWQRFCGVHKLKPGMSRRGNCWDNAVVESFSSSLKKERIREKVYRILDEARANVFDYMEVF